MSYRTKVMVRLMIGIVAVGAVDLAIGPLPVFVMGVGLVLAVLA